MVERRELREMSKSAREMARAAKELREAAAVARRTWQDYESVLEELHAAGVELEKFGTPG